MAQDQWLFSVVTLNPPQWAQVLFLYTCSSNEKRGVPCSDCVPQLPDAAVQQKCPHGVVGSPSGDDKNLNISRRGKWSVVEKASRWKTLWNRWMGSGLSPVSPGCLAGSSAEHLRPKALPKAQSHSCPVAADQGAPLVILIVNWRVFHLLDGAFEWQPIPFLWLLNDIPWNCTHGRNYLNPSEWSPICSHQHPAALCRFWRFKLIWGIFFLLPVNIKTLGCSCPLFCSHFTGITLLKVKDSMCS